MARQLAHHQHADQGQQRADRGQLPQCVGQARHDQLVGLRHQQGPAAVADRFHHGEAAFQADRVGMRVLQRPAQAHRAGGFPQVVAARADDVVVQRLQPLHAHLGIERQRAGRRHQRDPPARQVRQRVDHPGQVGQRQVQADHAARARATAGIAQRHVVGDHPHAAGGLVEVGLGPPAAGRGDGALVPALLAERIAVGDEIAVAAIGGHVAGERQVAARARLQDQQAAGATGGGLHHGAQGGHQFVGRQLRATHQVGHALGSDGHHMQRAVQPLRGFLRGGMGVATRIVQDQPAGEPRRPQH